MSLRIATAGLDLMADALHEQGADVTAIDWRPPASGDPDAVATLTAAYGDPRVDAANATAIARLQEARPMIVGAGPAGQLIPGLEGRMILHAGPPIEWDGMCAPQRNAVLGACVFEGWASTPEDAAGLLARGDVRLANAHSLEAAGAMCGVISPSMACWAARDEINGGVGYSPFNDGPGDAFWLGLGTPAAIERQRIMAEGIAPGFAAALRADGPIDAFALCAQGIAMGDDCHMRHQATTMLLLRQVLPAMAEKAPASVLPTARMLGANGHFALTVSIASARAALAGIQGTPDSSLVVFISRNGVEAAVQIAGLPGRWFTFPAPLVGDPLYRPGFSDADAAPDIGDSALVECAGLGGAASAASPSVAAFLGGGLAEAIERTRYMGDICLARSERLKIPTLDGEGTPLGVDARACVDLGLTPLINTGILHRVDGGQIGAGIARTPIEPIRAALDALVEHLGLLMADEWDATTYQRVSAPQLAWGQRVVERIPLSGDEDALDAGCGTGRVTRLLAERLPRGTVLGVNGSARMVEEASRQLAGLGERVRVRQADLRALELDAPVDLIVSTATFHWILDHEGLFARLHAALRPGGRLVAQCGGFGNIAATHAAAGEVGAGDPYAAHLRDMPESWHFAGAQDTVERLEGAGFTDARAWLEPDPAVFETPEEGAVFLSTVVLRHHLERLPEDLRGHFARAVADRRTRPDGRVELDYVRLNLEARRPG